MSGDRRIVGVAAGGSYATDSMDAFSDLDLVIAVETRDYSMVMADRSGIAASLGHLLAAFTGEHVGEPRLLICLFGPPLLHVDLKFVDLEGVSSRVEDPVVLWQRDGRLTEAMSRSRAVYPPADEKWIEDRFWVWVHYAVAKLERGEIFEAHDFLSFLRSAALGPLGLTRAGARANGVRKIESVAPAFATRLGETVARYDAVDCLRALRCCVDIYRSIRAPEVQLDPPSEVEAATLEYLRQAEAQLGLN
ncbi:MAG: aminoglycoside 6-adenylyltransferase [Acidobacteriota bacterium]